MEIFFAERLRNGGAGVNFQNDQTASSASPSPACSASWILVSNLRHKFIRHRKYGIYLAEMESRYEPSLKSEPKRTICDHNDGMTSTITVWRHMDNLAIEKAYIGIEGSSRS